MRELTKAEKQRIVKLCYKYRGSSSYRIILTGRVDKTLSVRIWFGQQLTKIDFTDTNTAITKCAYSFHSKNFYNLTDKTQEDWSMYG